MKTEMENTSIELPDDMVTEIDDRRHSTVSRSQWLRNSARVRLALEKTGRWPPEDIDVDLEDESAGKRID